MNAFTYYSELIAWLLSHVDDFDMFLVQSVVTCGALFWLLHRAWLTLWKPVPELISILGVEVPEPPRVSLAGIKADAVTLHWTRPAANKPVVKYLIQVNGVNVGESSRQETAITVTGLKAGHYYNVRVIAVGNNNFQAGSRVIRLRTYGRDGRPDFGNGRVPTNITTEGLQNATVIDSSDESAGIRSHGAGIETAIMDSAPAVLRESSTGNPTQRRNTGGRKHSPSTASDQPPTIPSRNDSDESMRQLTEKFEAIRAETEEAIIQMGRDAEDFKVQMAELIKERDEKRQLLKEKEEASEKLKKEVHSSERANRQAQNRKTTKEKALRDKQAERIKMQDDIARWRKEIQDMGNERDTWQVEKEKIAQSTERKVDELRDILRQRQNSLNGMEEEIRVKGLQIKELEEERQNVPGVEDDDEAKERDAAERLKDIEWEQKERHLVTRLNQQVAMYRNFEAEIQRAQIVYGQVSARHANNPLVYHGNASGVEFDLAGQRVKSRRSRHQKLSHTNTILSPNVTHPTMDAAFPVGIPYYNTHPATSPTFAAGPYFDMNADVGMSHASEGMSEGEIRTLTAGAPLSPTATSLLPSTLFADDEPPSPPAPSRPSRPSLFTGLGPSIAENDASSPESSSCSPSFVSSPQTSAHNLSIFPSIESDRHSVHSPGAEFGVIGSLGTSNARIPPARRFGPIGDLFKRGKSMQDEGPALGSLKSGQSQSLPRESDEYPLHVRNRRTSFSTGWSGLQFLNRGGTVGDVAEGNAPAPARNVARRRRGFNMFGSHGDDTISAYSERDPSSPRPASIASSDLPRPSTDSAPFGWPAAEGGTINKNSPLATNWSVHVNHPWSANPSRRPSVQQSSTALSSGIATEADEFLPPEVLSQRSSPPPIGVIGTRPQSSTSATPRLNPTAPTFKAMFGRTKTDRSEKTDKRKKDVSEYTDEQHEEANSPSEPRKSRDGRSIHTQTSVAESYDSLDRAISDTPSELTTPSAASREGKETSFQKLLRKGSSSKFSIGSFRGRDSSFFGGKKSSTTYSDRNASGDRSSSFGDVDEVGEDALAQLGRSVDSATSSPMTGTPRESKMSVNWGRFGIKKGKERTPSQRASLDIGERVSETEGTEDDSKDDQI